MNIGQRDLTSKIMSDSEDVKLGIMEVWPFSHPFIDDHFQCRCMAKKKRRKALAKIKKLHAQLKRKEEELRRTREYVENLRVYGLKLDEAEENSKARLKKLSEMMQKIAERKMAKMAMQGKENKGIKEDVQRLRELLAKLMGKENVSASEIKEVLKRFQ